MLVGFILSVAAGYFLYPYAMKLRWPKARSDWWEGPFEWEYVNIHNCGHHPHSVPVLANSALLTPDEVRRTEEWWKQANQVDGAPFYHGSTLLGADHPLHSRRGEAYP